MDYNYDTYCGLYCGACPILKANKSDSLDKMAKLWKMKTEEIKCNGCKTDTVALFCTDCKMKICAQEKNLEFCHECGDYPCNTLVDFNNDECSHHSVVIKNLEEIRLNGLKAWLVNQEKRWSCPECGTTFSWYEETCGKCGKKLYNAVQEEEDLKSDNCRES